MDATTWTRARELFETCLSLDPAAREEFLRERCGSDDPLRKWVMDLLNADGAAQDVELRIAALARAAAVDLTRVGQVVGEFRIVRLLGSGGVGEVYLAERADGAFRQQVALKLLKRGMDTDKVLQRFAQERRILASLDHPAVARLLGGGLTSERLPYFAMEYVDGQPIDKWCEERNLGVDQRLELFRVVCAAVSYAHRNLVVHRDLKPSNILVASNGQVKLLDFGIAKVLRDDDLDPTLTVTGARLMTPGYASPEQIRGEPVTTASDVFSLGVILYELLTGHRPHAVDGRSSTEIERRTCEDLAAPPSHACRRLRRRLAGDLDTICLMALRKEPARRYSSVDSFDEDIRRHLAGLPVSARRDTFGYRSGKFLRRHAYAASASLAIVALVVALVVFYTLRLEDERDRAQAEAKKSAQVVTFLKSLFSAADVMSLDANAATRGRDVTAGQLLERGAERVQRELADQPELRAEMLAVLGTTYRTLGEYERAAAMLDEAVDIRAASHGRESLATVELLDELGGILNDGGDYVRAESVLRECLASLRALVASDDEAIGVTTNDLGSLLSLQGKLSEAEPLMREAIAVFRVRYGKESAFLAVALGNHARILRDLGRVDEAEALMLEALQIKRGALGPRDVSVANALGQLGMLELENRGDPVAAERNFRDALSIREERLGSDHPHVAVSLHEIARALHAQGRYAEAEDLYRQGLALRRATLPANHPHLALSLAGLGDLLLDTGRAEEAQTLLREAVDVAEACLPANHWQRADCRSLLGRCAVALGNEEEGRRLMREALATMRSALARDDPRARKAEERLASQR